MNKRGFRVLGMLSFLFTILLMSSFAGAFYEANWGSTKDMIKQDQKDILVAETDEFLAYIGTLFDKQIQKVYLFTEEGLDSILYTFTEVPEELKDYIYNYQDVNKELEAILGKPLFADESWGDERFKNLPELALALGDLRYSTVWIKDDVITHIVYANDLNIYHVIFINPFDDILGENNLSSKIEP
ncbi:MAG TPA: hypothetical protein GX522_04735 [Firmicutes bacterium]|nr:hypothetical protein [Bacillota bacterium]